MKKILPFIFILSLLLSACGTLGDAAPADATATISPEDIRATADGLVYDMLTQTAAAMPSNTPLPPTETPLPPPTATITLVPTAGGAVENTPTTVGAVTDPLATATLAAAAVIPTSTRASASSFACTEQPLLNWTGDSVQLSVTNYTKDSTANVFLCIVTPYGESGYINVPLVKSNSVQVPYGVYSATAWVDGKKDFNAYVDFVIKSPGNIQLVIENERLFIRGGCAPDC